MTRLGAIARALPALAYYATCRAAVAGLDAAERALLAARALWAAGWGRPAKVEQEPAARDGLAVPWAPTSEELHERAGSPGAVFDLPIGKLCAACLGAGLPQGCQRCARRGGAT